MLLSFQSLFSKHTFSQQGEETKLSSLLISILHAWFLRTNYYVTSKISITRLCTTYSCEYKKLESGIIVLKI